MKLTDPIPVGLYIHLPWCTRKCPYCDFNSHETSGEVPFESYVDALLRDLETETDQLCGRLVDTIFIGGGTPSLFPVVAVQRLLDGVRARVKCVDAVEISLEANPGSADASRFAGFNTAGVTRLSVGVQSFRDHQLKRLGRIHDGAAARVALDAARAAGFKNINIDLMYGLPEDQSGDSLSDLIEALNYEPEHISWYQLTLEPGTALARNPPVLPEHDAIANEFDTGSDLLSVSGYEHYEVSAYAQPGLRAGHNLNYWQFGDYIGIGAGAHGKVTGPEGIFRSQKRRNPSAYLSQAGSPKCTKRTGPIGDAELITEFAINALRLREGFAEDLFTSRTGLERSALATALERAEGNGWIVCDAGVIRPTQRGFRFLNDLQLLFLP